METVRALRAERAALTPAADGWAVQGASHLGRAR
jgi:hypothetical protein